MTPARGTSYCRQAIALCREIDHRQGLASNLATLALGAPSFFTDTFAPGLSLADAVGAAEQATRIAQEIGWRAGEAFARFNLGFCLGSLGEYGPALVAAETARPFPLECFVRQPLTRRRPVPTQRRRRKHAGVALSLGC